MAISHVYEYHQGRDSRWGKNIERVPAGDGSSKLVEHATILSGGVCQALSIMWIIKESKAEDFWD